jgi:transposase InsO family protein
MKRRRALRVPQSDEERVPCIQALKAEHPFWGYRRLWAHLRLVQQRAVSKKRILRLMREQHLLVSPHLRLRATRPPTGSKPRPTKPHEWWGIDMTKVMVAGFGWVYIVVVLDWDTKKVVGHDAGVPCTAKHWLAALDMAVNQQLPEGARGMGVALMSDNGCQPTSLAVMEACRSLEIHQAFTSDNKPRGKADTERFMRTLKEECRWLQEWTCPVAVITALDLWIATYHEHYLHSALGYKTPTPFERDHDSSPSPPFLAA